MTRRSTIVAFGLSFLLIFLMTLVVMRGTVKKQSSVPNEVGTVEPALSNRPGFWIEYDPTEGRYRNCFDTPRETSCWRSSKDKQEAIRELREVADYLNREGAK